MSIKLSTLKPNPANPRLIKDERFKKLVQSIKEFPKMMDLRPKVIDKTRVIIGGNMRFKALQELGYKEVPESWVKKAAELSEEERSRFIIGDNVSFGENDWDQLANGWDIDQLQDWGLEIPDFAIKDKGEASEDDYKIPDEIETKIVPGDLFEIGEHRLLCGSSTEADDVKKLLDGKEPYLMVTDPPYGVNYSPEWRNAYCLKHGLGVANRATGKVDNDDIADWAPTYALSPCKVAYVWHAGIYASIVANGLIENKFEIRSQIIWNKQHFVFGRGSYHWKHEPCWFAVKKGSKGNWAGDRKQTTVWDIQNKNPMGGKSEDVNTSHSTQKPIECMARPIGNHDGDVYDPFLGSGTTMVAGHQLKRKVFGMEISPKYCQVIVDRMRKLDPTLVVKKNGKSVANQS